MATVNRPLRVVAPEPRPIVLQTRPMAWYDVLKVALAAIVAGGILFSAGYLWPHPGPHPAIIEDVAEELPAGVTQLYLRDPNRIVRWVDGAGVGREWRLTPKGAAALREWTKE